MAISGSFDFRILPPPPPLSRLVQRLWYARGFSPHGRERILPSASPVLLFVLGARMRMEPPDGTGPVDVVGVWLQGPHDVPILNEPRGETHALGAAFVPGGLGSVMTVPVTAVTNRLVPLPDVPSILPAAGELARTLRQEPEPTVALQCLNEWLTEATRNASDDPWLDVIGALSSDDDRPIKELQERLGTSRRHFIEQVKVRAGLPPKSLQRIARLRRLVDSIDARKPVSWSSEAVGAGFFDQPHAIRDFRRFTGLTPTEYVARRRRAWGDAVEPGEATNFVPEVIR